MVGSRMKNAGARFEGYIGKPCNGSEYSACLVLNISHSTSFVQPQSHLECSEDNETALNFVKRHYCLLNEQFLQQSSRDNR